MRARATLKNARVGGWKESKQPWVMRGLYLNPTLGPAWPISSVASQVLSHYVRVGVEELDQDKLTPLLRLKYHNSIADAVADLGSADDIRKTFTGFQKYLYQEGVAA